MREEGLKTDNEINCRIDYEKWIIHNYFISYEDYKPYWTMIMEDARTVIVSVKRKIVKNKIEFN